jgi:hypothetical protein
MMAFNFGALGATHDIAPSPATKRALPLAQGGDGGMVLGQQWACCCWGRPVTSTSRSSQTRESGPAVQPRRGPKNLTMELVKRRWNSMAGELRAVHCSAAGRQTSSPAFFSAPKGRRVEGIDQEEDRQRAARTNIVGHGHIQKAGNKRCRCQSKNDPNE